MATVTDEGDSGGSTEPIPLLLRVVLASLGAAALALFFYGNAHSEEYYLEHRTLEPWLWNLYLTCPLISLVGVFALWSQRQWGLWVLSLAAAVMVAIEVYALAFSWRTFMMPAYLALVWFAAQPVWKTFK